MLQIRHLDHVVLRVSDLQAMLHFYIDVLGCRIDKVQEQIGLWQVRAGEALIDLVPVDGVLGYEPTTATALMRNLVLFGAFGFPKPPETQPTTKPASRPTTVPTTRPAPAAATSPAP